jgi:hypothetical protein
VATDDAGDFVVAWNGGEINNPVLTRRFDRTATPLGEALMIAPLNGGYVVEPEVAMDGDGNYAVTWDKLLGPYQIDIRGQVYRADGRPNGPELLVHANTLGVPDRHPSVALDGRSGLVFAWQDYSPDQDESQIAARRYSGAAEPVPPRVTGVLVGGTRWSPVFRYGLEARGLGRRELGYLVPGGAAASQPLSWSNVNQVSIRFDRDVVVGADDLTVRGAAGGTYRSAEGAQVFWYNAPSHTATWTLARAFPADRLALTLDGTSDGVRAAWAGGPGPRLEGGDFHSPLTVLPGDVNRDGRVTGADLLAARAHHHSGASDPAAPADTVFADVDASGLVTVTDEVLIRRSIGRTLPPPASVARGQASRAAFVPPPRTDLFARSPIL